jgi:hypothetical protein
MEQPQLSNHNVLPPLDLGDQQSIALHRDAIVAELPDLLDQLGLEEQAAWMRNGEAQRTVEWFKTAVSVKKQGIAKGGLNLTTEQAHVINPFAIRHEFMSPSVGLWLPGDDLPPGFFPGDVRTYPATPDYDSMPAEVFTLGRKKVVGGAKIRGLKSRLDNSIEQIERSEPQPGDDPDQLHELVIFTGMRRTGKDEGETKVYRDLFPAGTEPLPIEQVFPTETHTAIGLVHSTLTNVREDVDARVDDPEAGKKSPERTNQKLAELGQEASRSWVTRYFDATTPGGKRVRVTVVNGEPILQPAALNRPQDEAAPVLAETFSDWLNTLPEDEVQELALSVNYPHITRIAARLGEQLKKTDKAHQVGSLVLAGNSSAPEIWNEVKDGFHQGATTVLKEIWPYIRVMNRLSGRPQEDLSLN